MTDFDVIPAFFVGLLGSAHCLGMCGGITTMLTSVLPQGKLKQKIILTLFYNLGRISTYALIGAVVAVSSSFLIKSLGMPISILRFISGIFLILLGLYIANLLMWLTKVEQLGRLVWSKLSPLSKGLLPVDSNKKAFLLGGLWGWLPCGLVYSTLTWALASGDGVQGAAIMASFGLGTLPAMMSMSIGVVQLQKLIQQNLFKKIAGISIIFYGIYTLTIASSLLF